MRITKNRGFCVDELSNRGRRRMRKTRNAQTDFGLAAQAAKIKHHLYAFHAFACKPLQSSFRQNQISRALGAVREKGADLPWGGSFIS